MRDSIIVIFAFPKESEEVVFIPGGLDMADSNASLMADNLDSPSGSTRPRVDQDPVVLRNQPYQRDSVVRGPWLRHVETPDPQAATKARGR